MTIPKTKEEALAEMDANAKLAKEDFDEMRELLNEDTLTSIAAWWFGWFPKAGHKRLAYILMDKPMPERKKGGSRQ